MHETRSASEKDVIKFSNLSFEWGFRMKIRGMRRLGDYYKISW